MKSFLLAQDYIPREMLFKPADILAVKVGPQTGQKICLKYQENGVTNLFAGERQVTFFEEPGIHKFLCSPDEKHLLFLKDKGGSRDYHIMGVQLDFLKLTNYTENFKRVIGKIYGVDNEKAVVGIVGENFLYHDIYTIDLKSGNLILCYSNPGYAKFWFDEHLELALKVQVHSDGAMTFKDRDDHLFLELSSEDAFHTEPLLIHSNQCYMLDTRTSDTTMLKQIDIRTRKETILGHDQKSDIQGVIFDQGKPIAYATCFTHTEWHALTQDAKGDLDFLAQKVGVGFQMMSQQGNHWIIRFSHPLRGVELYHYHRLEKSLELIDHSPDLKGLADMHPMVIPARDGLNLVSYLTLPKKEKGRVPLVIIPHGGPFKARDFYTYNPYHQWLSNRGYAVLSVNFRSSSGFGKSFVCAGNGEWGRKAQEDLIDAAEWCIEENIVERGKVAIFGASYGGYAGLAALTFNPDYFAGVVAACGPSNLQTVLNKVPLYWESPSYLGSDSTILFTKGAFVESMGGDPETEKGASFLNSHSPLNFVDAIKKPLLLIHGSNDPIVAQSESDQIYKSMKEKGISLTYLVFPDEGHGLSKFSNLMVDLAYSEKFLSDILDGSFQPIDPKDEKASSVKVY